MINRHQSQFIGQDLLSCFHLDLQTADSQRSYGNAKKKYEDCIHHYPKDHVMHGYCNCSMCSYDIRTVHNLINIYNHLIFGFETHHLTVERLPDEVSNVNYNSLLYGSVKRLQQSIPQENPISFYRVNIEKLAVETKGFNHALCQCQYPSVKVDQFSFLDYTHLSHVHLRGVGTNNVFT
ncbi:unnamed protein product [Adineta steineri]|uniref:Uncharacterized protein n=1 Tax=Adineta steineri TaxID=433720 RepID=A0A815Q7D9_9BILA|nr:unnamed protein product [Adineta steineri]CAF1632594.1 unnamed protein product [Adineta steineri]